MKKLEAIAAFLNENTSINLFNEEMEVQVNVGIDNGIKVERVSKDGHKYWGFEKDGEFWKPFRIPYNAKIEPNYIDSELRFSTEHFEAIGLTGWNWVQKESWWVGYDFDSIVNHSQGLSDEELLSIRRSIESIPWVTIRRSTSGKGLHFYVFFNPVVSTQNHTEHAALARSILGILSAQCGIKLDIKVDTCGGILWIWHRRQGEDGFTLVKQGEELTEVPTNWKGHIDAITTRKRQRTPTIEGDSQALEELIDKTKSTTLDDEHRRLLGWLASNNCLWWWDADRNILVAHTYDLARAHKALLLKGPFYTIATGKEQGNDQNCFGFPFRNGGWVIRRHTRRTIEHPAWTIDNSGWTRCYYNVPADLPTAARCHEGVERPDGFFELPSVEHAIKALNDLGAAPFECPAFLSSRLSLLKLHKDGRALLRAARQTGTDFAPHGWTGTKEGWWERLISIQHETHEVEVPDCFIRHLIFDKSEAGFALYIRGQWIDQSPENIKRALVATGTPEKCCNSILGQCVMNPWHLVSKPFQNEYPGNRTWNRNAAQFAFEPHSNSDNIEHECPNWIKVLSHCGEGLKDAVENSKWCQEYGIISGQEYLFLWIAGLFQFPSEPLPYLFFYGPQNSGKSIFHESLSLLFRNLIGYIRADVSLISDARFNFELVNGVLCIVEETNLRSHKDSYSRIKDWVTSRRILIHPKGKTPYEVNNTTHWIQCSNEPDACPIFPGDTRIVVSFISELQEIIPKTKLMHLLEVEAPAFLWFLLHVDIPASGDRLKIPIITSAEKLEAQQYNETPVLQFFAERVFYCPGNAVLIQELYNHFQSWCPIDMRKFWGYQRFTKNIPDKAIFCNSEGTIMNGIVKGRYKGAFYHVANIAVNDDVEPMLPLVRFYDKLVLEGDL